MTDTTIPLPPITVTPEQAAAAAEEQRRQAEENLPLSVTDRVPGGFDSSSGMYFDQITREPYLTRAVVVVNGQEYFEWESVTVSMEIRGNPPYSCRLTCSEQEPWPEAFAFFRIKPADEVTVYLDGYKAFAGFVQTRQVAYAQGSHAVEIQAVAYAGLIGQGTVVSQTGEFKNQDIMSIAQSVAKPFGVKVTSVGGVPKDKFPRATVTPGETAFEFIEKLARQTGVFLTSNPNGDLVLMVGSQGGSDDVVEGRNILEGREHVSLYGIPKNIKTGGQAPGNDDSWGADPTHQRNHDGDQGDADAGMNYMPHRILTELPAHSIDMLKQRFGLEQSFNDSVKIEAQVTLLGWKRPSGGLWVPGQKVYINAPMLILNRSLWLTKAVFTQDSASGTRTHLTLMNVPPSQRATE
jgi:prophage tail gpP-like protein